MVPDERAPEVAWRMRRDRRLSATGYLDLLAGSHLSVRFGGATIGEPKLPPDLSGNESRGSNGGGQSRQ